MVINGAAKEIGRAAVVAVTKARGMEVAGAVDSHLVGQDIGMVSYSSLSLSLSLSLSSSLLSAFPLFLSNSLFLVKRCVTWKRLWKYPSSMI